MRKEITRTGKWVIETKGEGFKKSWGGPKCQMLHSDQIRKDVKSVHLIQQ